jgi:hypothetical protein
MSHRLAISAVVAFLIAAMIGPLVLITSTERSQAAFGDNVTVGVNELSSGTVDVVIGSRSVEIVGANLAPGDRAVGTIEIVNNGTLPLRYALVSTATGDPLGQWLAWDLWSATTPGQCRRANSPGDLLASRLVLGSSTPTDQLAVLGDVGVGLDPGDRTIEPGSSDTICLAVVFELDAPDTLQGRRFEQSFTVVAEQNTEEVTP